MEDLAAEHRKQEDAKIARQKEHERLTRILKIGEISIGGNDMLDTSKQRLKQTLGIMKKTKSDVRKLTTTISVRYMPSIDKISEASSSPFEILEKQILQKHEKMQQDLR